MASTDSTVEVFSEAQLKHALEHLSQEPGTECVACHRPIPKVRADAKTGPVRSVVSIHEPSGEEGTLEGLMIQVVEKYKTQWPREHASMRQNVGLELVGGRCWKFHVTHFALYATLMVPGLEPTEGEE